MPQNKRKIGKKIDLKLTQTKRKINLTGYSPKISASVK